MNRTLLTALFVTLALVFVAPAQQTQPNADRLKADAKLLEQLQKVFIETQARNDQFGNTFWHASKRLADERGPEIVHAIMVRGRTWHGEEGLIFVPLVALLPRAPTLKLLKQYEHSKRE